jgi:hypothetical protein
MEDQSLCDDLAEMSKEEGYTSALGKTIATWRSGNHISFDLAAQLIEEGYDVSALEARHLAN